jgi:hypothetical protein
VKFLHRHKWHEVAREQGYKNDLFNTFLLKPANAFDSPVTLITYSCLVPGCRKFKQRILKGHLKDTAYSADESRSLSER